MTSLRYLPLACLFLVVLAVLACLPSAQATLVDSLQGLTPDSASAKLTAWLQVVTLAVAGVSALGGVILTAFFKLRTQVREQNARHDQGIASAKEDVRAVNAALPTPVPSIAPPVDSAPVVTHETTAADPLPGRAPLA